MLEVFVRRFMTIWNEARWVMLGQFVIFGGGLATMKLLTSELGPSMYGQLTLGVSIAGALQLFVYGPLNQIIIRYFSIYSENGQLPVYFYVLRKAHLYIGFSLFLISTVLFILLLAFGGSEWAIFIFLAIVYGWLNGIQAGVCAYYDATRNRRKSASLQSFSIWSRLLFALTLFYSFEPSAYTPLAGFCLGVLVVSIIQAGGGIKRQIKAHKNFQQCYLADFKYIAKCISEFKKYSFPFLLFALVGMFAAYADRWIIFERLGEQNVGIYVALYQVANAPVVLIMTFVQQFSAPIIFQRAGVALSSKQSMGAEQLLWYTVLSFTVAILPLVLIFWLYSEEIVRFFTSEGFVEHNQILWLIALGIMIFNLGQLFIMKGQYLNKPMVYLWPKALHALSIVVLMYYMVTEAGIVGAAYALCVSAIIYLILIIFVNRNLS